ncbi:hypothetical protein LTR85_009933 [Meristemomyces frigidus]|nr:hypothetical protein LTR85_009933 [Meristemomyces frigidus]
MCHAYFYHYPTCAHTSVLLHNLCENAVQRGREPCQPPPGSQPQCIVCDEPCPHCIGSQNVRRDDDREDLETVFEGSESGSDARPQQGGHASVGAQAQPIAQQFVGQQEAQWGFADANMAGQQTPPPHAGQQASYEAPRTGFQPGVPRAADYRWPLQGDDDDDDAATATELRSAVWNDRSSVTDRQYHQQGAIDQEHAERKELERQQREAELDEAQLQAALQASMHEGAFEDSARVLALSAAEAADHEQQMLELIKQISLHEAPANPHLAEQTEYAKAMRLPLDDEDNMLHEVKKASIRSLEEQHFREYERRHAAMASARPPTATTSQAG